jgi:DNA replication protein DnaC
MKELTKEIEKSMKTLSLKGMLEVYKDLALKASKGNLQYEEYLALLLEAEVKRKTEGSVKAKITKARFPYFKTIEEFDFSFQPHLNEKEVIHLSSLDFIDKKENILFLGPPGVGKTHPTNYPQKYNILT